MKTAVVLSGGGAKGAYQLGVWKALRKLHIKYHIVTGTSVGALNGVLMVQNSYYTANKIWKNISYNDIYGTEFENKLKNDKEIEVYKEYLKSFVNAGGMDITSLDKLFGKHINLWKFKLSPVNYGMITYNLTTFKPVELVKKQLLNNNLKDYVLASASCFPAIKPKTIGNQSYIDGGYYDNLPINLAITLGADRIIAVDLRAPGIKKNVTNKNIQIIRIYPRNKIVSFLVFDKEQSKRTIQLGYNDTMKTFNQLDGNKYTFRKNDLLKNYQKYNKKIRSIVQRLYDYDNILMNSVMTFNDAHSIYKGNDFNKLHNCIIEYLAKAYNYGEAKIYNISSFNNELLYDFEELGPIKNISETNISNEKLAISYIYSLINAEEINIRKITKVMIMFKKEFLGAIYISALENNI